MTTASFETTTTYQVLTTNLSTSSITGTSETTLTIGLGTPAAANMVTFVARTISIPSPSSDQVAQFVDGATISSAETFTIVPASSSATTSPTGPTGSSDTTTSSTGPTGS